ncbi:heavy metal-binding domain-containing protein [Hymenobacter glaciei]|uniref:heavy metal-binding domain-containing protein n=1 Tax=Hymenobacter glaciei TaxID=877209 RepID=UPI003CD098CC
MNHIAVTECCPRDSPAHFTFTYGVLYNCPVHPAVLTNEPGDCPKCKIALSGKS